MCQDFCLSDTVLNIGGKKEGLPFVYSSKRKNVGSKLATRGGVSAAVGLFHFVCTAMSPVTAVRGREI